MKKKLIIAISLIIVAITGYKVFSNNMDSGEVEYQLTKVTRGNIEETVSATGTVTPLTTVEVGTQISGTIDTVMVDYNDIVKVNQVLAVLDTLYLQASVIDAEASLERSQALLEQAQSDYNRYLSLYDKDMVSEADFLPYKISLKTSKADLKSAEANLVRAKRNLEYAVIKSPIDGIVIQKSVEEGQTVAASLSTPTLFVIAQDLSKMEILAEVDESDIGSIKENQKVHFEVTTYPDSTFEGTVSQIRLQPETVSNVVTYSVVVKADNPDGLLLPGMTATLDFVTEERENVLTVPNRALSFTPPDEALEKLQNQRQANGRAPSDGPPPQGPPPEGAGNFAQRNMLNNSSNQPGMVWTVDSSGNFTPYPVLTGLSDGSNTEIVRSRDLEEGTEIIVSSSDGSSTTSSSSSNDNQRRRPPGFGPGF